MTRNISGAAERLPLSSTEPPDSTCATRATDRTDHAISSGPPRLTLVPSPIVMSSSQPDAVDTAVRLPAGPSPKRVPRTFQRTGQQRVRQIGLEPEGRRPPSSLQSAKIVPRPDDRSRELARRDKDKWIPPRRNIAEPEEGRKFKLHRNDPICKKFFACCDQLEIGSDVGVAASLLDCCSQNSLRALFDGSLKGGTAADRNKARRGIVRAKELANERLHRPLGAEALRQLFTGLRGLLNIQPFAEASQPEQEEAVVQMRLLAVNLLVAIQDDSIGWGTFTCSNTMLSLVRMHQARVLEPLLLETNTDLTSLLDSIVHDKSGWKAHGISIALSSLGGLLQGEPPAVTKEEAVAAVKSLAARMGDSLSKEPADWKPINSAQALLGLSRLHETKAIDALQYKKDLKSLLDRIADPRVQGWKARQVANSLRALSGLAQGEPPAVTAKEAAAAAKRLATLMVGSLSNKSMDWKPIDSAPALLGLWRLHRSKAIDLSGYKEDLEALLAQIADDRVQGWSSREISNCLGALGGLVQGEPPAVTAKEAAAAAKRLATLMVGSLSNKSMDWKPTDSAEALLGLSRLHKAKAIDVSKYKNGLESLLDRIAGHGVHGADAQSISNGLSALGGLVQGQPPAMTAEEAGAAAKRLATLMGGSLSNKPTDWRPIHSAKALLGLSRLHQTKVIDLSEYEQDLKSLLDRIADPRVQGWEAQGIATALGTLGVLLQSEPPAVTKEEAAAAVQRLATLMSGSLSNKPKDWKAFESARALLGLSRLHEAKAINLSPHKQSLKSLLGRIADGGVQGWRAQDISTTLGALGGLVQGEPPAVTKEEVAVAAKRLATLMGGSLSEKPADWNSIRAAQALLGLSRLHRSKAIDLSGHKKDLASLLARIANDSVQGWSAQDIANTLGALKGLLQGKSPAVTAGEAAAAAKRLATLMGGSLSNEPMDWKPINSAQALLSLSRLHQTQAIDLSKYKQDLKSLLGRIADDSVQGWIALQISTGLAALGRLLQGESPAATKEEVAGAAKKLVQAVFGSGHGSMTNRSFILIRRRLSLLRNADVLPVAVWKEAAQALLERVRDPAFRGATLTSRLTALSLLRLALQWQLLGESQSGWKAYEALWTQCAADAQGMPEVSRLLEEGQQITKAWAALGSEGPDTAPSRATRATGLGKRKAKKEEAPKPAAGPQAAVPSPLGTQDQWLERLAGLAHDKRGLIDKANVSQRHDLRQVCFALNTLSRRLGVKSDVGRQVLQDLTGAVSKLNALLESRVTDDVFPYTAVDLRLVQKYLDEELKAHGKSLPKPKDKHLLSDKKCDEIAADAYRNLHGIPRLLVPQDKAGALAVAHLYPDGHPVPQKDNRGRVKKGAESGAFGALKVDPVQWHAVSGFKAMFGDEVKPPIIVHARRGDRMADLPAYLKHDGIWYRMDLFRGSRNKQKGETPAAMIGVAVRDAPLFVKHFFPTVQSRCYGQRAFLFEDPYEPVEPREKIDDILIELDEEDDEELAPTDELVDQNEDIEEEEDDEEEIVRDGEEEEKLSLLFEQAAKTSAVSGPAGEAVGPQGETVRVPLAQYLHEPLSNVPRELIGSFKVRCVADGKAEQLFKLDKRNADDKDGYEHLQVKDGCGFIHEDLYRKLVGDPNAPLAPHAADPSDAGGPSVRPLVPAPLPTDLASDALHHYPYRDGRSARPMVQEVLNRIKKLLGKPMTQDGSDDPAVEVSRVKANGEIDSPLFRLLTTGKPETYIGTAVPVKGDKLLLPDTPYYSDLKKNHKKFFVGRNPFDTRQLQVVDANDIELVPALNGIAIQYSLTGLVQLDPQARKIAGQIAKGLLQVVPRERWPRDVEERIVLSSKDVKTGREFTDDPAKKKLQDGEEAPYENGTRVVELHGVLGLKEQRTWHLFGTPQKFIEPLAGDYDGDEIVITPVDDMPHLMQHVIDNPGEGNPKWRKRLVPDSRDGVLDIEKVQRLMTGKLVGTVASMVKRFESLQHKSVAIGWQTYVDDVKHKRSFIAMLFDGEKGVLKEGGKFDALNPRHLAKFLGLKEESFDFENKAHQRKYMKRELELLHKAATDEEKGTIDYGAIDACRTAYQRLLRADRAVPAGVPYSKRGAMEVFASLTGKPAQVRQFLKDRWERCAYHGGLLTAILRESTRWFLELDPDRKVLIEAARKGDTALVVALLSGQSVDFDPRDKSHASAALDRQAVVAALQEAAKGGHAQVLHEILSSPLGLTLLEFDPQLTSLSAALQAKRALEFVPMTPLQADADSMLRAANKALEDLRWKLQSLRAGSPVELDLEPATQVESKLDEAVESLRAALEAMKPVKPDPVPSNTALPPEQPSEPPRVIDLTPKLQALELASQALKGALQAKLQLNEKPLNEALRIKLDEAITILLDHANRESPARLDDPALAPELRDRSRDRGALHQQAETLRAGFKPPVVQGIRDDSRMIRAARAEQQRRRLKWEASPLGNAFLAGHADKDRPEYRQAIAKLVMNHPDDLSWASTHDVTWLMNQVSGAEDQDLASRAMEELAERTLQEPFGWPLLGLGVRIAALAKYRHEPACQHAIVRLAANVPSKVSAFNANNARLQLSQLVGGLGHCHELVKCGALPDDAIAHVTNAIKALAVWVKENKGILHQLGTRLLCLALNGFSRYHDLVAPQCHEAMVALAQAVEPATDWGGPGWAIVRTSALLHGLLQLDAHDALGAVRHAAPVIEAAATSWLIAQAQIGVQLAVEPSVPGQVAVANLVKGLGKFALQATNREPLESAVVPLAKLIVRSKDKLVAFAPNSLAKFVLGLSAFQTLEDCQAALGLVVEAINSQSDQAGGLGEWTAYELGDVQDALTLQPRAEGVDKLLAKIDGELAKIARSLPSPAQFREMPVQELLARKERLGGHPSAQSTLAAIDAELRQRADDFGEVDVKLPVEVKEEGPPLHGIRPLRTPQKIPAAKEKIPLSREQIQSRERGCGQPFANVRQTAVSATGKEKSAGRYLYTLDAQGLHIAPESKHGYGAKYPQLLKHTNLSEKAVLGGEVWFHADGSVTINADSGRFGNEGHGDELTYGNLSIEQWGKAIEVWESLGYQGKVRSDQWLFPQGPLQPLDELRGRVESAAQSDDGKALDEQLRHVVSALGRAMGNGVGFTELLNACLGMSDRLDPLCLNAVLEAAARWLNRHRSDVEPGQWQSMARLVDRLVGLQGQAADPALNGLLKAIDRACGGAAGDAKQKEDWLHSQEKLAGLRERLKREPEPTAGPDGSTKPDRKVPAQGTQSRKRARSEGSSTKTLPPPKAPRRESQPEAFVSELGKLRSDPRAFAAAINQGDPKLLAELGAEKLRVSILTLFHEQKGEDHFISALNALADAVCLWASNGPPLAEDRVQSLLKALQTCATVSRCKPAADRAMVTIERLTQRPAGAGSGIELSVQRGHGASENKPLQALERSLDGVDRAGNVREQLRAIGRAIDASWFSGAELSELGSLIQKLGTFVPAHGDHLRPLLTQLSFAVVQAHWERPGDDKAQAQVLLAIVTELGPLFDRIPRMLGLKILFEGLGPALGFTVIPWEKQHRGTLIRNLMDRVYRSPASIPLPFHDAGCEYSDAMTYEGISGPVPELQTRNLVPPLEQQRRKAEALGDPAAGTIKVFSAPWIDGKPYHEAQQFANCGLHTLNNLLMRMSNGDTSLLVTRPMLERYIKKAFDEAFARRGFLEGQDPDEIYDRELNDRFKEYFLDDLSGYGGAHADQGFLPFGMQEGSFQSSGLLLQDQDEIDQCEAIGVAFQFAHANESVLSPHIVMIERSPDGHIVMRDSRPRHADIRPAPLAGASMHEAIASAIHMFGFPAWARDVAGKLADCAARQEDQTPEAREAKLAQVLQSALAAVRLEGREWSQSLQQCVAALAAAQGDVTTLRIEIAGHLETMMSIHLRGVGVFYPKQAEWITSVLLREEAAGTRPGYQAAMQRLLAMLKRPEAHRIVAQVAQSIAQSATMQPDTVRIALADVMATLGLPRASWPQGAQTLFNSLLERLPQEEQDAVAAGIDANADEQSLLECLKRLLSLQQEDAALEKVGLYSAQLLRRLSSFVRDIAHMFEGIKQTSDELNVATLHQPLGKIVPDARTVGLPAYRHMALLLNAALTHGQEPAPLLDVLQWDLFASSMPDDPRSLEPLAAFNSTQSGLPALACATVACHWAPNAHGVPRATLALSAHMRQQLRAGSAVGVRVGPEPAQMWVLRRTPNGGWMRLDCAAPDKPGEVLKATTLAHTLEAALNTWSALSKPASIELLYQAPTNQSTELKRKRDDTGVEPALKTRQEVRLGKSSGDDGKSQLPHPHPKAPPAQTYDGDRLKEAFDAIGGSPEEVLRQLRRLAAELVPDRIHADFDWNGVIGVLATLSRASWTVMPAYKAPVSAILQRLVKSVTASHRPLDPPATAALLDSLARTVATLRDGADQRGQSPLDLQALGDALVATLAHAKLEPALKEWLQGYLRNPAVRTASRYADGWDAVAAQLERGAAGSPHAQAVAVQVASWLLQTLPSRAEKVIKTTGDIERLCVGIALLLEQELFIGSNETLQSAALELLQEIQAHPRPGSRHAWDVPALASAWRAVRALLQHQAVRPTALLLLIACKRLIKCTIELESAQNWNETRVRDSQAGLQALSEHHVVAAFNRSWNPRFDIANSTLKSLAAKHPLQTKPDKSRANKPEATPQAQRPESVVPTPGITLQPVVPLKPAQRTPRQERVQPAKRAPDAQSASEQKPADLMGNEDIKAELLEYFEIDEIEQRHALQDRICQLMARLSHSDGIDLVLMEVAELYGYDEEAQYNATLGEGTQQFALGMARYMTAAWAHIASMNVPDKTGKITNVSGLLQGFHALAGALGDAQLPGLLDRMSSAKHRYDCLARLIACSMDKPDQTLELSSSWDLASVARVCAVMASASPRKIKLPRFKPEQWAGLQAALSYTCGILLLRAGDAWTLCRVGVQPPDYDALDTELQAFDVTPTAPQGIPLVKWVDWVDAAPIGPLDTAWLQAQPGDSLSRNTVGLVMVQQAKAMGAQLQQLAQALRANADVFSTDRASDAAKNMEGIVYTWQETIGELTQSAFADANLEELDRLRECLTQAVDSPDVHAEVKSSLKRSLSRLKQIEQTLFVHRADAIKGDVADEFHIERQRGFRCAIGAINAALGGVGRLSWARLQAFLLDKMQLSEEQFLKQYEKGGIQPEWLYRFITEELKRPARLLLLNRFDEPSDKLKQALAWPGRDRIIVNARLAAPSDYAHFFAMRRDSKGQFWNVDAINAQALESSLRNIFGQQHSIELILLDDGHTADPLLELVGQSDEVCDLRADDDAGLWQG